MILLDSSIHMSESVTQSIVIPDAFLDGKLSALRVLLEAYVEMHVRGVRKLTVLEVINTVRTLILNLEEEAKRCSL